MKGPLTGARPSLSALTWRRFELARCSSSSPRAALFRRRLPLVSIPMIQLFFSKLLGVQNRTSRGTGEASVSQGLG